MSDYIILEKYLLRAVSYLEGSVAHTDEIIIRCNICGDSKNVHKKRGRHLLINDTSRYWIYKCWNGDCAAYGEGNAWSSEKWLEKYFPDLYREYKREILRSFKLTKKDDVDEISKEILELRKKNSTQEKKKEEEKDIVKHFKPILSSNETLFTNAVEYCKSRRLPEEIWSKFYVAVDGKYKDRLIIPFYNGKNVYYWQGRSLVGKEPKYLNRRANKDTAIYNIFNIDQSEPVFILEGPIDSMFIQNSIATTGLSLSTKMKELLKPLTRYWLLDNDSPGKKYSLKYLKQGDYVFRWDKFLKDNVLPKNIKDINECILYLNKDKFTKEELLPYFTNSYYDTIYFKEN